jgi:hypothetical protein
MSLRFTVFVCHLSVCFPCHPKALQKAIKPKTCLRQKPIGALNSARIGKGTKPKKFKKFSSKIGEVWKELKI